MNQAVSTITNALRKIASLRTMGLVFLLFLISYTVINGKPFGLAQLREITGGASIPDMEILGYSPQRAYDILTAQGQVGRAFYLQRIIPQDFVLPLLYALFYAMALNRLAQRLCPPHHPLQHIGLLGLCTVLADWAENLCLFGLLLNYPQRLDALAMLASIFTVVKTSLSMTSLGLILVGLGWLVVKTITTKMLAKGTIHE